MREPGTRARSGNAMARTRSALLDAAHACLAKYGIRKTTMVDVASSSGVPETVTASSAEPSSRRKSAVVCAPTSTRTPDRDAFLKPSTSAVTT